MKKGFLCIIAMLFTVISYAQNDEIDIKWLHSTEGKQWKVMVRPDGYQLPTSMTDDLFIFFSNRQFKYDQSGTPTSELLNARTKTWSYNPMNNVVTWEFYMPNGATRKMDAEVTYIDHERAVLNLSENGQDPNIVVLITH